MRMLNPPHPGSFIRTEIIAPLGLSVTAAARVLRVSRPALSSLLNGKADLSGQMALRIEKAFGVNMETLMRMQSAYDIACTRAREKTVSALTRHSFWCDLQRLRPQRNIRRADLRAATTPASQQSQTATDQNVSRRLRSDR